MLTPVDIQQKKFHVGLGYDKKDVNSFFEDVARNYEDLYRTNADLKERVTTLTDALQNYKSKEAELEKSLMRALKDSEDTKSKAVKEAKSIELEARNKAKSIIGNAEERLINIQNEIALLETQYAAYKANFCNLMQKQFEFLKVEDFDAHSYIDERVLGALIGAGSTSSQPATDSNFGTFSGDPQMRDSSSLGGMNNDYSYKKDNITSTSAVYTSHLGANDNFVDPFNPNKDNNRFNPYSAVQEPAQKKKSNDDSSLKVANAKDKKVKRTPVNAEKKSDSSSKESSPSISHEADNSIQQEADKVEIKQETNIVNDNVEKQETNIIMDNVSDDNATINDNDTNLSGEVETPDGVSLLEEDDKPSKKADEFGFEFV